MDGGRAETNDWALIEDGTGATVVLVEDDDALRQLVRLNLEDHPTLRVVAEAPDGASALAVCARHRPGVVVLDLGLPDITGQEVLAQLRMVAPSARVVIFSGDSMFAPEIVEGWGAEGLVGKERGVGALIRTLERVAASRMSAEADLHGDVEAPRVARRFVEQTLAGWGCETLLESAVLVVSELVTNAVSHANSACTVVLRLQPGWLRIEVSDRADASPEPQPVDLDGTSGRGLMIVGALSDAWGVEPQERGKCVWAVLATTSDKM